MREAIAEINEEAIVLDPEYFDRAIIGYASRCGMSDITLYDIEMIIQILMEEEGFSEEDAWDHFDYNIRGSYMGVNTPLYAVLFRVKE